jgi:predicted dehydrogenase
MTGGVVYTYRGSWCAEGLNTPWASEWHIICEKGSIKWDGAEHYQVQVLGKTGGFISVYQDMQIPEYDAKDKVESHASLIKEFIHCVETGEKPETVCTDNIKSLGMVFGAIESAERQSSIDIKSDIL